MYNHFTSISWNICYIFIKQIPLTNDHPEMLCLKFNVLHEQLDCMEIDIIKNSASLGIPKITKTAQKNQMSNLFCINNVCWLTKYSIGTSIAWLLLANKMQTKAFLKAKLRLSVTRTGMKVFDAGYLWLPLFLWEKEMICTAW